MKVVGARYRVSNGIACMTRGKNLTKRLGEIIRKVDDTFADMNHLNIFLFFSILDTEIRYIYCVYIL